MTNKEHEEMVLMSFLDDLNDYSNKDMEKNTCQYGLED